MDGAQTEHNGSIETCSLNRPHECLSHTIKAKLHDQKVSKLMDPTSNTIDWIPLFSWLGRWLLLRLSKQQFCWKPPSPRWSPYTTCWYNLGFNHPLLYTQPYQWGGNSVKICNVSSVHYVYFRFYSDQVRVLFGRFRSWGRKGKSLEHYHYFAFEKHDSLAQETVPSQRAQKNCPPEESYMKESLTWKKKL